MPSFSKVSNSRLSTCHPSLVLVAKAAIKVIDFSVISGHRDKKSQDAAVAAGNSKTPWPKSRHNKIPSEAMDLAPYPIDWSNKPKAVARFYLLAGVVIAEAYDLGIKLRWGGDWDGDWDLYDQNFDDLGHFELVRPIK